MQCYPTNMGNPLFDIMFDNTLMAIGILDDGLNFLQVNRTLADRLQRITKDLEGQSISDGPLASISHYLIDSARANEPIQLKSFPFDFGCDGNKTFWDCSISPFFSEDDKGRHFILSLVDVTGRETAQQRLRKTDQLLFDTLESTDIGFISVDTKWRFSYVNKAAYTLTGHPLGSSDYIPLVGRMLWDVFPQDGATSIFGGCQLAMKERVASNLDFFWSKTNRWYNMHVYPTPSGIAATFYDISKRKQAEANLKMSEQKFAKAFHSSPVMVSIRRLDDSRYLEVNELWLQQTGYTRDEIIGRSTFEINIVDEETILLTRRIENTGTGVRSRPIKYRTKQGELRDAINSLEIIELNGELCMFSVTLDITEQRALERDLQRLDRLKLIGQMASGLGHEIRNPLTTVRGFLQLFTNRYPDARKHFDLMISEIDRANKIITEFLSLSRTKPSNLVNSCLNTVIETIDPMIQAHATQMGKKLSLDLGTIPPLLLDESEIRQVLLNLIHNGLEAISGSGSEGVVVRTYVSELHVVLEVQDFGCGIDPDIFDQLGTPFVTTKADGTGLGLAITYNIVRRHGGKVDVRSNDKGTTFAVYFPRVND